MHLGRVPNVPGIRTATHRRRRVRSPPLRGGVVADLLHIHKPQEGEEGRQEGLREGGEGHPAALQHLLQHRHRERRPWGPATPAPPRPPSVARVGVDNNENREIIHLTMATMASGSNPTHVDLRLCADR